MKKIYALIIASLLLTCSSIQAQSSFIDLTIVDVQNYNKTIANFSYSNFENVFKITSSRPTASVPDINRALVIFLNILEEKHSYMIQHEPTYYFVFQYDEKNDTYLVMNNSIGEKNEAMYCNTFQEAKKRMFLLLQTFYNNIPAVSIKEYN